MQWTVRKRLGNDLRFDFNYTWSKSIDLNSNTARNLGVLPHSWDPNEIRGISDYDVTHAANMFAIWELPVGKGKRFLGSAPGVVQAILGGWQLSGSWFQSSGLVGAGRQRERLAHQLGPCSLRHSDQSTRSADHQERTGDCRRERPEHLSRPGCGTRVLRVHAHRQFREPE